MTQSCGRPVVLVLGATGNQVALVRRVQMLGAHCITADWDKSNVAHRFSDEAIEVSTTDLDALEEVVHTHLVDGVVSCASDKSLSAASRLCDRLDLPGPSTHAVELTSSKSLFRTFQRKNGLPHPAFECFRDRLNAFDYAHSISRSLVVKPVDSSGSNGVATISPTADFETVKHAIDAAFEFSQGHRVIIEDFVDGTDHTIEGFLVDGKIDACGISDKTLLGMPHRVPLGHMMPTGFGTGLQIQCREIAQKYLDAMGVSDGPFDIDVKRTEQGAIVVLEMALRIGGNAVADALFYSTEADVYRGAIELALGQPVRFGTSASRASASRLIVSNKTGVLRSIPPIDSLFSSYGESLAEVFFDYDVGAQVSSFSRGADRIGHYVVKGSNRKEVSELSKKLAGDILVDVS